MRPFDGHAEPVHSRAAVERAISHYELLSPDPFVIHRAVHKNGAIVDFGFEFCNPAAAQLFGKTMRELRGASLLKSFPHLAHDPCGFTRYVFILEAGEYEEADVAHPLGIPKRTMRRRLAGLYDNRIAVSFRDTRAEARANEQIQLSLDALQRRLRGQLGLVQAICNHSLGTVRSLAEFRRCFPRRIAALAEVESLVQESRDEIRLSDLVERVLAPFEQRKRSLDGDVGIAIPATALLPLALALHELGINAARRGSWWQADGQIELCWRPDGRGLQLEWSEPPCSAQMPPDARDDELIIIENAITSLANGRFEMREESGRIRYLMNFDTAPTTM